MLRTTTFITIGLALLALPPAGAVAPAGTVVPMTPFTHGVVALKEAYLNAMGEAKRESAFIEQARLDERFERALDPKGAKACKYVSAIAKAPPPNRVALTFDDGPDPFGTPLVLEVLRKHGLQATFFFMGKHARAYPHLVEAAAREGHVVVASHSMTHPNFHNLSVAQQTAEIEAAERELEVYLSPKLFRFPYGNSTCDAKRILRDRGYGILGWHVDSCDWGFNATGTVSATNASICEVKPEHRSRFVDHVVSSLRKRKGGILLMHDVQPNTIVQLDAIVTKLRDAGLSFGGLDDKEFKPYRQ